MAEPNAENFFTEEEKKKIEEAVRLTENRTSGEVVPMIVDQSYDYPRAEIMGGGLFALAGAVTLSWAFGGSSIWSFLPLFFAFYFLFKWLIRSTPGLKRRLINPAEIDEEVEEKAMISFLENGIYNTRDRTGILILISLFEHRVYVLADQGINEKVSPETWDEIVASVTAGIKEGKCCEALCSAIERCGELLVENFPVKKDDTDELPNLILEK